MNTKTLHYVGVDVCKQNLDVQFQQNRRTIPNEGVNIVALLNELRMTVPNIHVVCEATGGYEQLLVATCHDLGIAVSLVNALRVRDFARASGKLAKTDAIDAGVIQGFGQTFHPAANPVPQRDRSQLSAAIRRRDTLMRNLTAEKNTLGKVQDRWASNDLEVSIRFLQRRLRECDKQIDKLIALNTEFTAKKKRMEQVKGVGRGLTSVLIAEMPELGSIDNKKASSLVGLAPMNRDSGSWRGKRTIHGGRSIVRRSLYMPAMSAIRANPVFKGIYTNLRAKGKPHHVALTAVMRKMVCLLNRILADPEFKPS